MEELQFLNSFPPSFRVFDQPAQSCSVVKLVTCEFQLRRIWLDPERTTPGSISRTIRAERSGESLHRRNSISEWSTPASNLFNSCAFSTYFCSCIAHCDHIVARVFPHLFHPKPSSSRLSAFLSTRRQTPCAYTVHARLTTSSLPLPTQPSRRLPLFQQAIMANMLRLGGTTGLYQPPLKNPIFHDPIYFGYIPTNPAPDFTLPKPLLEMTQQEKEQALRDFTQRQLDALEQDRDRRLVGSYGKDKHHKEMIVAQERGDEYLAMAIVVRGKHTLSALCVHPHPHPHSSSGAVKVQDAFPAGTAVARGGLMRSCWTLHPSWRRSCSSSAVYPAASVHLSSTS